MHRQGGASKLPCNVIINYHLLLAYHASLRERSRVASVSDVSFPKIEVSTELHNSENFHNIHFNSMGKLSTLKFKFLSSDFK